MLTEIHLKVLNLLPDADYWEDCIINHYQQKNRDLNDVISDMFVWMKVVKNNSKPEYRYCCLIPDRSIMWKVLIKLFCEVYEIRVQTFIERLMKWMRHNLLTYGEGQMMNIYWARYDWLGEIDIDEILSIDWDTFLDELGQELLSNFPSVTPEIKKTFLQKIKWRQQNSQEQSISPSEVSQTC